MNAVSPVFVRGLVVFHGVTKAADEGLQNRCSALELR